MSDSNYVYSVYYHRNTVNGKVYVGASHKHPIIHRWQNGIGYKRNKLFYADIELFGWDNFEHVIVKEGLTEAEASALEKELIKQFESTNPDKGYNFERGGLSHAEKERCEKISRAISGENHPMYGKPVPEETRKRIGDAMRGEKGFWYGKKLPQETLDKMSNALKGRVIDTEKFNEHCERIRKPVRCVERDIVYASIKAASKDTGISAILISRCCHGNQNQTGGYHWEFV